MTLRSVLRLVVLTALVLLVQWTVGIDIRVAGAHPDLMMLLPIASGMAGGPDEGAAAGFLAGMAADLLLPTPFGLSALVWCLVGFGVGASTGTLTRRVWWVRPAFCFVSSAVAVLLYAVLGALLGQQQFVHVDLVPIVLVVGVVNAALAAPAVVVVARALAPSETRGGLAMTTSRAPARTASRTPSRTPARRW